MKKSLHAITVFVATTIVLLLLTVPYLLRLDHQITSRFEGRRWELPARIYARPLELYVDKDLRMDRLKNELDQLLYRQVENPENPGEYAIKGSRVTVFSRSFPFPDTLQAAARITLEISNNRIAILTGSDSGEPLGIFRLEPIRFASIYPSHNEDRLLVTLNKVPELLLRALLQVEDKQFQDHRGVRPIAILRAALANLKAGKTVQGGSTLTQQLVKNIFLSSERTILRKINEAVMALLLEYHYSKDEILETYINEIYLGQDGKRAIHGFALASRFYFGRDLGELAPEQLALLVGIVKGASYYNPRQHPQRAQARRNQVLDMLTKSSSRFTADEIELLKQKPLGVTRDNPSSITAYPAFLQLVRKQLARDYQESDLQSEGLSVFTTLDPVIQQEAEQNLQHGLSKIEKRSDSLTQDSLQGAMVIASVDQGEVVAVVGDRFSKRTGFNRALDMNRPVGSIIKPAVYLTALAQPESYNLLTTVYDTPLIVPLDGDESWEPANYDHLFHGPLPLMQALVHSYNVATVQLGMELGLDRVTAMLKDLGIDREISPYPSLLLGAVELPPLEVLQMYQTIAAGGYKTPLRAILAVTDQDNNTLQRYPLTVRRTVDPDAIFCLTKALHQVTTAGTAKNLQQLLPADLQVAGKTGTTGQLRDSWFAGFSNSHVAVTWVGRDDNQPTELTGATGALSIWAATMAAIDTRSLAPQPSANIEFFYSDTGSSHIFDQRCGMEEEILLPFIKRGSLPRMISCRELRNSNFERSLQQGLERVFDLLQ